MFETKQIFYFLKNLFLIFLFMLFTGTMHQSLGSQQSRISTSPLSALIHQPVITSVVRDSKGILWIGTQQGLYRFDGAKLTVFNSESTSENWIPASDIRGIAEDSDHNLLIATYGGGLLKWNKYSEAFEPLKNSIFPNEDYVKRLFVSMHGDYWIGTKEAVIFYKPKSGNTPGWFHKHPIARKIGQPFAFVEDQAGTIFVGSESGLYRITPEQKTVERIHLDSNEIAGNRKVTALEIDNSGKIFIGTNRGLLFSLNLQNHSTSVSNTIRIQAPSSISSILLYEEKLLIGTDKGLSISDSSLSFLETLDQNSSQLSSNDVTTLYRDGNDIWIGTYQGLDILAFVAFRFFDDKNSDVFNDVLAFEEGHNGKIWIGTYNGLFLFDDITQSHKQVGGKQSSAPLVDQRIMTIAARGEEIWLGFHHGGVQIVNGTDRSIYTPELPHISELAVTKILITDDHDAWIATYDHGLFRSSSKKVEAFLDTGALPEKTITIIFKPRAGYMLVGAENKLYQYNPDTDQFSLADFNFGDSTLTPSILSINQNKNGDIWIGTKDHGLFTWSNNHQQEKTMYLSPVGVGSKLPSATIYGIEFDADGNIWCSTENGLVRLTSTGEHIARYTNADGLQGNDFNFGASFTSSKGEIYFGEPNGYNKFDAKDISVDLSPPPVLLTSILFPKKKSTNVFDFYELKNLHLTHHDYFVTFEFSVLDFVDPDKNQFRYMLENFDPEWIESGTRNTATYTNLPPGDYILRVQGANSAGIWNREGLSLNVHVSPPPWRTWWAYFIYAAALLFFLWILKRVYDSYVVERKASQMAIEMHEAENRSDDDMQEQLELQDDLVKSAYRHNIATLALVRECISHQGDFEAGHPVRESIECSIKRISALSKLEDCFYFEIDGPSVDLHKFTDIILSELLNSSPVRAESITTINEVTTKRLPAELASQLSIVILELLENCIEHAFEPGSPANYIQVKLDIESTDPLQEQHYRLTVLDSGTGIPENIDLITPRTSGLSIVRAIAQKLSGTLHISSENGTTVSLVFPLGYEAIKPAANTTTI